MMVKYIIHLFLRREVITKNPSSEFLIKFPFNFDPGQFVSLDMEESVKNISYRKFRSLLF